MDGYGELQIFHRIVFPLMGPALATLGHLLLHRQMERFLTPMIILFDNNLQTLAGNDRQREVAVLPRTSARSMSAS